MFEYSTEKIRKIFQVISQKRKFLSHKTAEQIKNNKLISSYGFKLLSDIKELNSFSSEKFCIPKLQNLLNGALVYIHSSSLEYFAKKYLSSIEGRFTIISGDSDILFDAKMLRNKHIEMLISSEKVEKMYCQNLNTSHPKLDLLPIGLNYHTMYEKTGFWKENLSPMQQESNIIKCSTYSFDQKIFKMYCNWHFNISRGDRKQCQEKVQKKLTYYEPVPLRRSNSHLNNTRYAFTLCPSGEGPDCHRIYEAIILGSIPILKKSSFSKYLNHLPLIEVDCWSDLTKGFLEDEFYKKTEEKFDFSILRNNYWINKFKGNTVLDNKIKYEDFLKQLKLDDQKIS